MRIKTFPIFMAFLLMGVADAMGPLSDAVRTKFQLSAFMATLMPFFVFIAFAIFSVPGGVLAARIGKKKVLLLGLGLTTLAVGVPALMNPTYPLLLGCIFILGIGTTFLQVAGNPIMRDVSAKGDYSRNLALAQGFKGIGSAGSAFLPTVVGGVGFLAAMGWRGAFPIFFALMAIALVLVMLLKVDETRAEVPPSIGSSLALLKNPTFALAVLGIFLYVGAEVCMGTFLKPTLAGLGLSEEKSALFGPSLFFGCITIGRLIAGVIKVNPQVFFRISALLGLIGVGLVMSGSQMLVLAGVVLGAFGFANIWPMLFSITVEEKPEAASELSGLMCMAISGGAIVPLIMGKLRDGGMTTFSFIVPAVCFAYLLLLSLKGGKSIGKTPEETLISTEP
jgi:fucose permease